MFLHKKEITDPFKNHLDVAHLTMQPRGRDQHDGAAAAPGTCSWFFSSHFSMKMARTRGYTMSISKPRLETINKNLNLLTFSGLDTNFHQKTYSTLPLGLENHVPPSYLGKKTPWGFHHFRANPPALFQGWR